MANPLLIDTHITNRVSERGNIPVAVRPQPLGVIKLAAISDRPKPLHRDLRKLPQNKTPHREVPWWGVANLLLSVEPGARRYPDLP